MVRDVESEKVNQKDIWGRSVWIDLFHRSKDVKMLVSHVNAHPKVVSAQEEFSNQGDGMTNSGDSQSLPQPSLSLPNGPMKKVALVAEMRVYMSRTTWTSTCEGQPGYSCC